MYVLKTISSWMTIATLASIASVAQTTLSLTPIAQAAAAQTAQTTQAGQPQVELALVNPTTSTLTGTFVPSTTTTQTDASTQATVPASCRFSVSLPAGQKVIEVRQVSEVAVDTTSNTCNAQVEVGQPQEANEVGSGGAADVHVADPVGESLLQDAANTAVKRSSATPADETTTGVQLHSLILPPGGGGSVVSAGYLKTWWIDPVNIIVNSVQNSTTWSWSGSGHCVTGILGGQSLTWFTTSGWLQLSDSWQNTFNCSQTTSASTVLYYNPFFCDLISTYASYAPNKVNGLQNGTLVGTWNDTVYGSPCVSLLRFRMQLRRTQN